MCIPVYYPLAWKKDKLNLNELAAKRWGERWTVDKIAAELGWGRTFVVRKLRELKNNPELIEDGSIRSRVKSRKHRFMGSTGEDEEND
jgi:hypothetical protein